MHYIKQLTKLRRQLLYSTAAFERPISRALAGILKVGANFRDNLGTNMAATFIIINNSNFHCNDHKI